MYKNIILGIESSCDDTSAAVIADGILLSNIIAGQQVHENWGGVVPELASRAHQQNIVPVVHEALKQAGVKKEDLTGIAFTRGPGLLGSLMVGTSFAKSMAQSLRIPMMDVNHLQAHVLAHFIRERENPEKKMPAYPFLCLLVSGGNSQIILVRSYKDMEIIGQTIDDAAGEAFDKCAKVMGLPYPGGPHVDKLAQQGNPDLFPLAKPLVSDYNYSFSGLKTSFLYLVRDKVAENPDFIAENITHLCAAVQKSVVEILMKKLHKAARDLKVRDIALAGGVSANSALRKAIEEYGVRYKKQVFIPPVSYTTDNAAMIAVTGYLKFLNQEFCKPEDVPYTRVSNKL